MIILVVILWLLIGFLCAWNMGRPWNQLLVRDLVVLIMGTLFGLITLWMCIGSWLEENENKVLWKRSE